MPYIHFTEEQKLFASSVNLEEFLRRQGEELLPSGREYRLVRDHSITVRGNQWYDHAMEFGGGPVSFVRRFYELSYPEAMTLLLSEGQIEAPVSVQPTSSTEKKEFSLPPASKDMRRLYAYMLKQRCIDREVLNHFVRAGLVYESCEPSMDGTKEHHNAVFVGKDENGIARHAHKRGLYTMGKSFKRNVAGCNPRYSFHHVGTDDQLFVFEAPIDLLSFVTLHPDNWQSHSYAALCGTSSHAMLWMLEQNPQLQCVALCLDHDEAGMKAARRLMETLKQKGYPLNGQYLPMYKDWNEDLKAEHGMHAQPAEEPKLNETPALAMSV